MNNELNDNDLLNISSLINVAVEEISIEDELHSLTEIYSERVFHACGGFKKIERARDNSTDRIIALATPLNVDAPLSRESFLREGRILASLQHPNIVPLYAIGFIDDNIPCFSMKLIQGESFDNFMKTNDTDTCLDIFLKVCDAVAYAHNKGIIHRDIKPANIQISSFGEVQLCDWGLARVDLDICEESNLYDLASDKFAMQNMTLKGTLKGTPGYIAPEQISEGRSSQTSDIYALGGLLFHILYGRIPCWAETNQEIITNTLEGKLQIPSSVVAEGLMAVCQKALAFDPKERYQTVNELYVELRKYLSGFATLAEKAGPLRLFNLMIKRHKNLVALSCTFFVLVVLLVSYYVLTLSQREEQAQELLLQLKEQHSEKLKLGEAALPAMMRKAEKSFLDNQLNDCQEFVDTILKLDPDFKAAVNMKARLLFLRNDFADALELMSSPEKNSDELILKYCRSQKTDKDLSDLIDHMYTGNYDESIIYLMHFLKINNRRADIINKLTQWRSSRDVNHLLTLAESLESAERQFLLKRILFLIQNQSNTNASMIAQRAAKISPQGNIRDKFLLMVTANIALQCKVSATGTSRHPPQNAVDGLPSRWEADPYPASLILDLGSVKNFNKFLLYFHYGEDRYYQYRIYLSDNGLNFRSLIDRSDFQEVIRQQPQTIRFAQQKARYVKVEVVKNSANTSVHIREFQIYLEKDNKALGQFCTNQLSKLNNNFTDGIKTRANSWSSHKKECEMDLGEALKISKLQISTSGQKNFTYTVMGSLDGKAYTILAKGSGNSASFIPQEVRYLKLLNIKTPDKIPLKITELEVF